MDFNHIPNDFQSNKIMFFKDMNYSESTKKMFWRQYLNFIVGLETEFNKDLYDLDQEEIQKYKDLIKEKSSQTIASTNSFINKYMEWYAEYYKVKKKAFDLTIEKESDNSWYINKEDFFKMCDKMKEKTSIPNIIPIIFARYGFMGKENFYMRNVRWRDINYENKTIAICNEDRNILSYIPVDENFLIWIDLLKSYEDEKHKRTRNNFIVKSQVEKDRIIEYSSLNSKVYNAFKSIGMKRISFTILNNCALVDCIDKICDEINISSNDILKDKLSIYYPIEPIDNNKIVKIKNLYIEVTKNENRVRIYNKVEILIPKKEKLVLKPISPLRKQYNLDINDDLDLYSGYSKNKIIKNEKMKIAYIITLHGIKDEYITIDLEDVPKVIGLRWYINTQGKVVTKIASKHSISYLANLILNIKDSYKIRHKNNNKLDCRKKNLKVVED